MTELTNVQVMSAPELPTARDRPVVFHGANKTGSLAMADVMRDSYAAAHRSSQFFSVYHHEPQSLEQLEHVLGERRGHGFFIAHYLYRRFPLPPDALLVSQVRHPLPRTLSVYGWLKRNYQHRHRTLDGFPSLPSWVRSTRGVSFTQMLQFAIGFPQEQQGQGNPPSPPPDELLDQAIDHLRREFAWFGCAELFEQSIFAMAHICGLTEIPLWQQDKRNRWKQQVNETDASTLELIHEVFAHEFSFYEQAVAILEERLGNVDFGPSLAQYRELCIDAHSKAKESDARKTVIDVDRADRRRVHVSIASGNPNELPGVSALRGSGPPNEATIDILYGHSPYADFDLDSHEEDLQGWNSHANLFRDLILEIKPRRIFEIGVWKGAASIHMAKILRELDLRCELICVDTWLGSPEHFLTDHNGPRYRSLRLRNGYPQLFYTFLGNVIRNGVADYIVPLPMTSDSAATVLNRLQLHADLIHIDAAHDYPSALRDFHSYWQLLSERGVLIGDDYLAKAGVTRAADEFAQSVARPICGYLPKFVVAKSPEVELSAAIADQDRI